MATRLETKEIMDNPNAIATTGGADKHELKQAQTKDSLTEIANNSALSIENSRLDAYRCAPGDANSACKIETSNNFQQSAEATAGNQKSEALPALALSTSSRLDLQPTEQSTLARNQSTGQPSALTDVQITGTKTDIAGAPVKESMSLLANLGGAAPIVNSDTAASKLEAANSANRQTDVSAIPPVLTGTTQTRAVETSVVPVGGQNRIAETTVINPVGGQIRQAETAVVKPATLTASTTEAMPAGHNTHAKEGMSLLANLGGTSPIVNSDIAASKLVAANSVNPQTDVAAVPPASTGTTQTRAAETSVVPVGGQTRIAETAVVNPVGEQIRQAETAVAKPATLTASTTDAMPAAHNTQAKENTSLLANLGGTSPIVNSDIAASKLVAANSVNPQTDVAAIRTALTGTTQTRTVETSVVPVGGQTRIAETAVVNPVGGQIRQTETAVAKPATLTASTTDAMPAAHNTQAKESTSLLANLGGTSPIVNSDIAASKLVAANSVNPQTDVAAIRTALTGTTQTRAVETSVVPVGGQTRIAETAVVNPVGGQIRQTETAVAKPATLTASTTDAMPAAHNTQAKESTSLLANLGGASPIVNSDLALARTAVPAKSIEVATALPDTNPIVRQTEINASLPISTAVNAKDVVPAMPAAQSVQAKEYTSLLANLGGNAAPITSDQALARSAAPVRTTEVATALPGANPVVRQTEINATLPISTAVNAKEVVSATPALSTNAKESTSLLANLGGNAAPLTSDQAMARTAVPAKSIEVATALTGANPVVRQNEINASLPISTAVNAKEVVSATPALSTNAKDLVPAAQSVQAKESTSLLANLGGNAAPITSDQALARSAAPVRTTEVATALPGTNPIVRQTEINTSSPISTAVNAKEAITATPALSTNAKESTSLLANLGGNVAPLTSDQALARTAVPAKSIEVATALPGANPVVRQTEINTSSPITITANAKEVVSATPTALIGNAKEATTLLSNLSSVTGFRQNEIHTAASQQAPAKELAASALPHTSTTAISHSATSTIRDISPTTASTLKSLETLTNGLLEPPVAAAKIAELTLGQVNGQKMFFTELAPTAAKDQSPKPESKASSATENLLPIKTFTIKTTSSTEATIEGKVIKPTTTANITTTATSTTGAISPANVITESEHGKDKDPLPALTLVDSKGENGNGDGKTENKKEDKTSKDKDDETTIKQLTDKEKAQREQEERDQAFKAILDAAKKKAQTTGPNAQQYDPDKRRVHVIQQGETLASIAAKVLGDATLADLIYKINEGLWASKTSHDKRSIRLEFAPGTVIFLPTRKEIADYRKEQRARLHEQIRFEYAPRSNSKGLRQALAEKRVPPVQVKRQFESDITSDTDALEAASRIRMEILHSSDGKQYVSHRLEHFDLGDWQTVVEYRAGEESMLRTISRSGKERQVPLDLPTDIVDSMAISDLTTNRVRYLQRYLAGKRLYC